MSQISAEFSQNGNKILLCGDVPRYLCRLFVSDEYLALKQAFKAGLEAAKSCFGQMCCKSSSRIYRFAKVCYCISFVQKKMSLLKYSTLCELHCVFEFYCRSEFLCQLTSRICIFVLPCFVVFSSIVLPLVCEC